MRQDRSRCWQILWSFFLYTAPLSNYCDWRILKQSTTQCRQIFFIALQVTRRRAYHPFLRTFFLRTNCTYTIDTRVTLNQDAPVRHNRIAKYCHYFCSADQFWRKFLLLAPPAVCEKNVSVPSDYFASNAPKVDFLTILIKYSPRAIVGIHWIFDKCFHAQRWRVPMAPCEM